MDLGEGCCLVSDHAMNLLCRTGL